MKIKCLANPTHDQFMVTVQVAQDWKVDENGSFLECTDECSQVYQHPNTDSYYECAICGAEAKAY